jgi:hypothetical protein
LRLFPLVLLLATTVHAAPPTAADLARARGDASELARLAERLGPAGLRPHFTAPPEVRRAALAAARLGPDAARVLPWLAALAAHADPDVARDAADAAATIARQLEPVGVETEEVPRDVLLASAQSCQEVARGDRPSPVRLAAFACAVELARLARAPLPSALDDPDPLLRRAALPFATPAELAARAADGDDAVALSAVGWSCTGRTFATLPAELRARAATLVLDPTREPADLSRVLRCLRASQDRGERAAAAAVARSKKHPPAIRRVARSG